jgi:hypothetical protein
MLRLSNYWGPPPWANAPLTKIRYRIEQYFGISERYMDGGRARFTTLRKEHWNRLCQLMAFNTERFLSAERHYI